MTLASTWVAAILFVLFFAPGIYFDLLSQRRRVGPEESAFREAGRIALAGIAFSSTSTVLLLAARNFRRSWALDPHHLLKGGSAYVADHYPAVFGSLGVEVLLALLLAYGWHRLLMRGSKGQPIRGGGLWEETFVVICPDGRVPFARVQLVSGRFYSGIIADYTTDPALLDRELVLSPPLQYRPAGERGRVIPLGVGYERVVLASKDIESIDISYCPAESGATKTPSIPSGSRPSGRKRGRYLSFAEERQLGRASTQVRG